MTCITIHSPATAAAIGGIVDLTNYDDGMLFADGLAGAEEVDIFVMGGQTLIPYTVGTTVQKLTATAPMLVLQPGVTYSVSKDATVGACGVYVHVSPKN
jgi:hypothetical protein